MRVMQRSRQRRAAEMEGERRDSEGRGDDIDASADRAG
jgi:hypothetical protein